MTKSALAVVVSLLIAAASVGFAVGQAVGPGEASAAQASANPNRAVVKQLKKLYRLQFESQVDIVVSSNSIERQLETLNDTIGTRGGNKSVRELIRTICQNTPGFFSC